MSTEPFTGTDQREEADRLGMWLFLATEAMMFGALFFALTVVRLRVPDGVRLASGHLDKLLGTVNTGVLLTSSLLVALAVAAARQGRQERTAGLLAGAAGLGVVFLAIKATEYAREFREGLMPGPGFRLHDQPGAELFFNLYYAATGLHAVHLTIGVLLMLGLSARVLGGWVRLPEHATTVELPGLYWHIVDIVWVFLYPALYLVAR
ncbi:cytochrome c oxidase subunit 3 [Azospirillum sp.]|uniref:cytochrome c oxidase subunit 3 n=1 Tax=Azospirillum sp. TaxID=34012 RepID=UPI003D72FCDE